MREECPICLLNIVEGEAMTRCSECSNYLHHHCMSVWADSLALNGDGVYCPLCRHPWSPEVSAPNPPPALLPAADVAAATTTASLPIAAPVSTNEHPAARPWIALFGEDLVSCLFSREWTVREAALRRLISHLFARLEAADGVADAALQSIAGMIEHACHDPVLRVYSAALGALPIFTAMRSTQLKNFVRPIVLSVLVRCGDINLRVRCVCVM